MDDKMSEAIANGPGAAAILSAAVGCLTLSVFALAGDAFPSLAGFFTFWTPTGPLSGVTDGAIIVWLATWFGLSRLWARREVDMSLVNKATALMFVGAFLLTFPPVADLLQGK